MTTMNAVKNIAKGLTLGISWPAAVGYVAGRRVGKFLVELSHDSLDTAIEWMDSAEQGIVGTSVKIPLKKPVASVRTRVQRARSVGAAAASDDNVAGKPAWATFYLDWWDGKLSLWAYLGMAVLVFFVCIAIKLSVATALIGMVAAFAPMVWKSSQMVTA
jgi:hypothetical protein